MLYNRVLATREETKVQIPGSRAVIVRVSAAPNAKAVVQLQPRWSLASSHTRFM